MGVPAPSGRGTSERRAGPRGWWLMGPGLALILAIPVVVVAPTVVAMVRGAQPAWLVDPVVRAVHCWRIELALAVSGYALALPGLWIQRRDHGRTGASGAALTVATLILVGSGGCVLVGLFLAVAFILLLGGA